MPVKAEKRGRKFRVVESDTGKIARNFGGTALDGGGHTTKKKATAQARAVNRRERSRRK